ncbi:MAG: WYL domain-containing protein [Bifidobacterium sp.]|nr:WYL domain-containing protein [Bifidobacterium sp.]
MSARSHSTNSVLEIFALLLEETDENHGLTEKDIRRRLLERHEDDPDYIAPSLRTIYNQMDWLKDHTSQIMGQRIRRIDPTEINPELHHDVKLGWYMTPLFTKGQMRLLADSLMLMHLDEDTLNELIRNLDSLTGQPIERRQLQRPRHLKSYTHVKDSMLSVIETIDEAIALSRCITFNYCNMDADGNLVPRQRVPGTPNVYRFDPYGLVFKTGRYFLIGHYHDREPMPRDVQYEDRTNLNCFVVNRIINVQVTDEPIAIPADAWTDNGLTADMDDDPEAQPFDPVEFARMRPHMTMGVLEEVELLVRSTFLTNLFEWFDDPEVTPTDIPLPDDGYYLHVRVRAPEMGMLWWVLQYAEWNVATVLKPDSLRRRLAKVGMALLRQYARQPHPSLGGGRADDDAR